ncbi:phosphotransferase [Streptomyces kaniharaensis]|uniref:Phosphotransferase n=1 Tax=Streptomyces kaniharaensis TaxID=212423 RepID=A0A6N7KW50_9ACTN|nr:phosphotransferase [Streptomyces kaniharaensis]MQS15750.1 phosphotransferase [Streptomyces kaniharaensis]
MTGCDWTALPRDVRLAVEAAIGRPVITAEPPRAGTISDFAATLRTEQGDVFCKAVRTANPEAWKHRKEAEVNPLLRGTAPRLEWLIETGGWLLLGFEHLPGRHAELRPGSPDLPLLAAALAALAERLTPAPPVPTQPFAVRLAERRIWRLMAEHDRGLLDAWAVARLEQLVRIETTAPGLVDGDTLSHTDLSAGNLLVDGWTVRAVDWAWPARAAAWTDTASLVLRLIHAGHSPQQAEEWAGAVPAWKKAAPEAITAFAVVIAGVREHRRHLGSAPRLRALAAAGRRWVDYRLHRLPPTP